MRGLRKLRGLTGLRAVRWLTGADGTDVAAIFIMSYGYNTMNIKRLYGFMGHSGQAHKHFSHRFDGVSFLAHEQTWR